MEKLTLKLQQRRAHNKRDTSLVPEIELLREYRRVQHELGRCPTSQDMALLGKYNLSTYSRRYGSWAAFRKVVNNPIEDKLSKEKLIENFYEVKKMLGKVPTGQELGRFGKYGVRTYHKHFGGHKKLLQYLNEE